MAACLPNGEAHWLRPAVLINLALDGSTRRSRRQLELTGEAPPELVDDGGPTAIDTYDRVLSALAALPPRTRSLRPRLAVGALAGAAGTAGAVIAAVSLGAGASNAFAGWSSTPTPPSPTQLAAAGANCKQHSPIAGLPPVLTDTRGPFTFVVYANQRESAECISGPSFTSVSGSMSSAPIEVPAGQVLLRTDHETRRDGQAYSFADGHTGSGVRGVKLVLDDGKAVQATVENGRFVAWWPSAHEVKTAKITTDAGVRRQTFDLSHESPCGAKLCTGGGAARGSSLQFNGGPSGSGSVRQSRARSGASSASYSVTR